ncbi:MAG: hypothetical protein JNJ73_14810 [Hyphomonadaceae bacterium]|nr:hypothetical protein [Hyphomonadaceae bacterium]
MAIPYRAEHVGSLLRPTALIEAREAWEAGRMQASALKEIEDHAILDALEMQRQTGVSVLSDGEFRRSNWGGGFLDALEGLGEDPRGRAAGRAWKGAHAEVASATLPKQKIVTGKLRAREPFASGEASFLKAHAGAPFKITIPSPTMFHHLFTPGLSEPAYASSEDVLEDLVQICTAEIDRLHKLEVPYIQLDSLRYINVIDAADKGALDPTEAARTLDALIAADNRVLASARRDGVTRGVHLCRGNHRSSWTVKGSYDSVAEKLFAEVDADRFLLEYDDERSGGFEPLRFMPKGKVVVLGLVTTKSPQLETIDALRRRVDEAAKFVPFDNLAIGTQCGFASTHLGNLLTEDEERKKLELVAEAARRIWG